MTVKVLKPKCECGYISVETQDRVCPIDKDEVEERIYQIDDMIEGMQTRMRLHSEFIMTAKKGLLHELAEKYVYRLDTCSRALGRLINYKKKLHNLVE